jgi:hypothetical protein
MADDLKGPRGYFEIVGDQVTPINRPPRVDFWVCPREDEPDTWFFHPGARKALCTVCGEVVVYLTRPGVTPAPEVPKICHPCMTARVEASGGSAEDL